MIRWRFGSLTYFVISPEKKLSIMFSDGTIYLKDRSTYPLYRYSIE
jgi:hypothetical protein